MRLLLCVFLLGGALHAQEADAGFDLRSTLSVDAFDSRQLTQRSRFGDPVSAGFRALLYPTWKLGSHWSISGAVQIHSRPYFAEEFTTQGYGVKSDILQANLTYSRIGKRGGIVVRAGQMTSAFGSFLLRYDPHDNPLVGTPAAYGYYYKPVTSLGLMGAQMDATFGRLDLRAQLTNSSPSNRRSIFDRDQYGTWTMGGGYTIKQGFRVGASLYRGPYLDRKYPYFFPGEAAPNTLPATGFGIDVQWGHGPWNVWGEWQRFQMDYRKIPTFHEHTAYAEVRRVLNPRWYIAERAGYVRASAFPGTESYETAIGFRLNTHQILKFDYLAQHGAAIPGTIANVGAIQLVTSIHILSLARD